MKVSIVFDWRNEAPKKGDGLISVRVYDEKLRTRSYTSTGVRVRPEQWDGKQVVEHSNAVMLNNTILRKYKNALSLSDNSNAPTFLDWVAVYIEKMPTTEGTRKHHRTTLMELEKWGKIRLFSDVCPQSVRMFLEHVKTRSKWIQKSDGRTIRSFITQQTAHNYYKNIATWIRAAQIDGLIDAGALLGVRSSRGKSAPREHLNEYEIKMWCDFIPKQNYLAMARDRFIVQMCTGLSYSDLVSVDFSRRFEMDGCVCITGRRNKTNEDYFAVILPEALPILERWEWKVPYISNQKYNEQLKEFSSLCGIRKNVTSHVARHTYACRCLAHGISMEALQRTLGHNSIRTTQIYGKLVDTAVVKEFSKFM